MRHRLGNTPRCGDCYFFRAKEYEAECSTDGWCLNGMHVNGKKVKDVYPVSASWECSNWEDAEDRITHYEALTRQVDPSRKGFERLMYEELLRK